METLEDYLEYFIKRSLLQEGEDRLIGENSCPYPELKVAFDGFADDGDDEDSESYVIYVHKNSLNDGFIFPEHISNGLHAIQRPNEEAYFYAWYDKITEKIEIINVDESLEESELSEDSIKKILIKLFKKYKE